MSAKPPSAIHVDEFKVALDNRAFEIQLFWQRSNYFLVLMSALGIGTFSIKSELISPVVSLFAVVCSYFWFQTNLGSKFWQEFWEAEVAILAPIAGVKAFEKTTSEAVDQVTRSLKAGVKTDDRRILRKWVHKRVVEKPSVTYNMILLSLCATAVWAVVFTALLWRALPDYALYFGWLLKWVMAHLESVGLWFAHFRTA